jgi:hypothetical protein
VEDRSTQQGRRVGNEAKLTYLDSRGNVRTLRGIVSVDNQIVRVDRRDGTFMVPIARVLEIEAWNGTTDSREARP